MCVSKLRGVTLEYSLPQGVVCLSFADLIPLVSISMILRPFFSSDCFPSKKTGKSLRERQSLIRLKLALLLVAKTVILYLKIANLVRMTDTSFVLVLIDQNGQFG